MIRQLKNVFVLDTKHTTYAFQVLESGHLEHLYYGKRIRIEEAEDVKSLAEKQAFPPGNSNVYDEKFPKLSLENMRLEMSAYGKSDIREPFIEVIHGDGSYTSDFLYEGIKLSQDKSSLETLPSSYEENGKVQELTVLLRDKQYDLYLELHYGVFEDRDVISRSAKFVNTSKDCVKLTRLMSMQLDFEDSGYVFTTFNGNWAREMYRHDTRTEIGKVVNASYTGCSSNRANPFVMLSTPHTSEDTGVCYGFNLI